LKHDIIALINGRLLNVGVHTLTKGYFLKYSGLDFSGALATIALALARAFFPPIYYVVY
jgi:hypothetical protein